MLTPFLDHTHTQLWSNWKNAASLATTYLCLLVTHSTQIQFCTVTSTFGEVGTLRNIMIVTFFCLLVKGSWWSSSAPKLITIDLFIYLLSFCSQNVTVLIHCQITLLLHGQSYLINTSSRLSWNFFCIFCLFVCSMRCPELHC